MMIEVNKLMTVKHYADAKKVSTTAVYTWLAQGKIKEVKIDGVTFIELSNEDYGLIKNK